MDMSNESREFLEKHLPSALQNDSIRDVLVQMFVLIDEKGFAPPHYDEYNDFGRAAQRVYDDLYLSNVKRE